MDKMYIYIGVGVLVVVVIIAIFLILKKKKSKNSGEPIHKEYDSSIANMVNNEPVKGGTFIPTDPVNPNAAPMPIPSVVEPQIDTSAPDMMMNQPIASVTPNPIEMPTTLALEAQNTMNVTAVQEAPVIAAPQPASEPVAPITPDLMTSPTNVGMVAEPLIEQQPVAVPAPAPVEEPKFYVEIPEVDAPPMPEVAPVVAAPVMQNTEIPGPVDNLNDSISGVTPTQPKKEPMFVFDVPEEPKSPAPIHQEIEVDVPDMEEMV